MVSVVSQLIDRLPINAKKIAVEFGLVATAYILGFGLGVLIHERVVTQTVHVHETAAQVIKGKSGASLVKLLGKPDQEVPGSGLSDQLAGLTCGLWQSRQVVICWKS